MSEDQVGKTKPRLDSFQIIEECKVVVDAQVEKTKPKPDDWFKIEKTKLQPDCFQIVEEC